MDKSAIKFSIIIPYTKKYNLYFNECLESVLNQKYKSYELIIVASKSESSYLKKTLRTTNKQIKIINSKYKDQSHNRNLGIKAAKYQFLVFVDCDDVISSTYLQISSKIIRKYQTDIILFNHTRDINMLGHIKGKPLYIGDENAIKSIFFGYYSSIYKCPTDLLIDSSWSKIFNREIIIKNNVFFDELTISAEDALFVRDYAIHVNNAVIFSDYYSYFWRINPHSTMRKVSDFYDINQFCFHLTKTLRKIDAVYTDNLDAYLSDIFVSRFDSLMSMFLAKQISSFGLYLFLSKKYNKNSYIITHNEISVNIKNHYKNNKIINHLLLSEKPKLLYSILNYKMRLILHKIKHIFVN